MYRRRRLQREKIFFSFDSFLDVVANVIGIIIRLILVAWVGARTYTASMQFVDEEPPATEVSAAPSLKPLPPPRPQDDPLASKLELAKQELAEARNQLLDRIRNLETADKRTQLTQAELDKLTGQNEEMEAWQRALEKELAAKGQHVQLASLSLDGLRKRGQEIAAKIKEMRSLPPHTKELKYHTPVSRTVEGEELFFECRLGKVAFIDMPAFMYEIKANVQGMAELLRKERQVTRVTSDVGSFRLRYVFEREGSMLESPTSFRYGLSGWTVEPLHVARGETLPEALKSGSQFHRVADAIDPNQTVVTLWVYPDSFEIFRALRDYLYERDIEVAGRPLPMEGSIAASRSGTRSRGQ